jgi:hypothetical protein
MTRDLDDAAAELDAAKEHLRGVLVVAAGYVERRAAEGDPEAAELARLIAGAFDQNVVAGIAGRTALEEETHG